jgi:hypothetical protein
LGKLIFSFIFYIFQVERNRFLCTLCSEEDFVIVENIGDARQHWRQCHSRKKSLRSVAINPPEHLPQQSSNDLNGGENGNSDGVRAAATGEDVTGYQCNYCDYVASVERYKILHEKRVHLKMDCKAGSFLLH